jgi:CubicO group peptidase (beta-lactamase class C family)
MVDMLLDTQYYSTADPRPYDDTGWTLGPLRNVTTVRVTDPSILDAPMTLASVPARADGGIESKGSAWYVLNASAEPALATLRFRLKDVAVHAAEEPFEADGVKFAAGSFLIAASANRDDLRSRLAAAAAALGIKAHATDAAINVKSHPVAVPRIAVLHTWVNTQNDGWFRLALEECAVPYAYISDQDVRETPDLKAKYDVIVFPPVTSSLPTLINGVRRRTLDDGSDFGGPVPWKSTELTPNLGGIDEADDIRGGLGFEGLAHLKRFVENGGVFIPITASTHLPVDLGMIEHVTIAETQQLQAIGSVLRASVEDQRSPIAYGYDEKVALYFNQAPIFRVALTGGGRGGGRMGGGGAGGASPGRASGRGSATDPDVPQGRPAREPERDPTAGLSRSERELYVDPELRELLAGTIPPPRLWPRVVLRWTDEKELWVSGMLASGSELAATPAVIDVPLGRGHVVLFGNNPMWRQETQGSFMLLLNAALHFDHLHTGHRELSSPAPRPATVAALSGARSEPAAPEGKPAAPEPPVTREAQCRRAAVAPVIDGKLDDSAWAGAAVIDRFPAFWDRADTGPGTRARLVWDDDALYFAATMTDAELRAFGTKHNDRLWLGDVFELFFKPATDRPEYYEFQVNPRSVVLELAFPKRGFDFPTLAARPPMGMAAVAVVDGSLDQPGDRDRGWSVEGRIPWSIFAPTGGRPAPGTAWRFALCRYDYGPEGSKPILMSSAPLTQASFHRYEDYGLLRFEGPRTAELPTAPPEAVGLSAGKLAALTPALQKLVDEGKVPGGVAQVVRRGKVAYTASFGDRDLAAKTPMTEDTIFAIASMTKPVTCVAAMTLIEQGKLGLDDPVGDYLPELKQVRVLGDPKDDDADVIATVPARQPITVRHLLAHTSGVAYPGRLSPNPRLDRSFAQAGLLGERRPKTIAELVEWLGKVALAHQPGEGWTYGYSHDVLGRLVEVVSGQSFDQYLQEHILKRLDMHDTAFLVPEAKRDRVATIYRAGDDGALTPLPKNYGSATLFSGGGGLFSTARDYSRFAEMLLEGGELQGQRILRPETVRAMTTNQVGELETRIPGLALFTGMKYGLGFGLELAPAAGGGAPVLKRYFWGGLFSTNFWIDPQHEVVAVIMTQVLPTSHGGTESVFRQGVNAAIED